jgi:hypothetical protein
MLDGARKRLSANPHDVLRNLAGLKNDSAVGFLPVILLNPRAERALHDLRAIALRFLDVEFLTAIRPSHSEAAYMLVLRARPCPHWQPRQPRWNPC